MKKCYCDMCGSETRGKDLFPIRIYSNEYPNALWAEYDLCRRCCTELAERLEPREKTGQETEKADGEMAEGLSGTAGTDPPVPLERCGTVPAVPGEEAEVTGERPTDGETEPVETVGAGQAQEGGETGPGKTDGGEKMNWEAAISWLDDLMASYQEIGWPGTFGLAMMRPLKRRVDKGERTRELYDEIMALE